MIIGFNLMMKLFDLQINTKYLKIILEAATKTFKNKGKGEIQCTTNYYESNAYILVYIKNSLRDKILSPVTYNDILPALRNRFENDKNEERKILLKKN